MSSREQLEGFATGKVMSGLAVLRCRDEYPLGCSLVLGGAVQLSDRSDADSAPEVLCLDNDLAAVDRPLAIRDTVDATITRSLSQLGVKSHVISDSNSACVRSIKFVRLSSVASTSCSSMKRGSIARRSTKSRTAVDCCNTRLQAATPRVVDSVRHRSTRHSYIIGWWSQLAALWASRTIIL